MIDHWRRELVMRRGLLPGAPVGALMDLVRTSAWVDGIDMTVAPDEVVMGRVWTWMGLGGERPAREPEAEPGAGSKA